MSIQDRDWSLALTQSPGNVPLLIEAAKYFIGNDQAGIFLSIFDDVYSDQFRKTLPPQIIFSIGQTALQEHRWDLASKLFSILRIHDQTSPALIAPLSEALLRAGRLSEATDVLQHALSQQVTKDPSLLSNLAIAQAEQGLYVKAESTYREVLSIRPNEFLSHFNFAGFLDLMGRVEEAIISYEQCLKIVPDAPEALTALGAIKKRNQSYSLVCRETRQNALHSIYHSIEQKNWEGALELISHVGHQIDPIRKLAAILELPQKFQDQFCDKNLFDPILQVKVVELFKEDDPILDDLTRIILSDNSLVWDRAGKPTRHGAQSHELLGHRGKHKSLDLLIDRLISLVTIYRSEEIEILTGSWKEPILLSGWSVVLKNGGFQRRHIHPESKFSGVFYVNIPKTSSKSNCNSGNLRLFGCADISPLTIAPSQGSVVLFPSYIPHETIPLVSTEPRICIAFNVL